MGIGKSSCQDVCMWNLCGSKEVSKIDSGIFLAQAALPEFIFHVYLGACYKFYYLDTRNTTVKRLAAMKTFPTTIEVINLAENFRMAFLFLGQLLRKQRGEPNQRLLRPGDVPCQGGGGFY